jgi:hypothetical protein
MSWTGRSAVAAVLLVACQTSIPTTSPSAITQAAPTPSPRPTVRATPTVTPTATSTAPPVVDIAGWKAIVWSSVRTPGHFAATDVVRWGDGFMAVGYHYESLTENRPPDAVVALSEDGVRWEHLNGDVFRAARLDHVTQLPAGFAAWGSANEAFAIGDTQPVLTSADGRHWQRHDLAGHVWISGTANGLIGWQEVGPANDPLEWLSTDGVTWRSQTPAGIAAGSMSVGWTWTTDTRFGPVIVGRGLSSQPAVAYRSTDGGETWHDFALPSPDVERIVAGPRGAYALESSSAHGFTLFAPRKYWRTMDGSTWEGPTVIDFPELGRYDGTLVLNLDYCEWGWDWPTACALAKEPGAPVGISTDGVLAYEIPSFAHDSSLLDSWFGQFGAAAVGKPGVIAFEDDGDHAWLGSPSTDPNPPGVTFPPAPKPTP